MAEIEPYKPGLARNKALLEQLKEFQRNPRSLIFVSLAEAYRAEGLPHQAIDILDEGLHFHPGLASALVAKARALFDLRRYGDALKELQTALGANPQNLKARKLQAEIFVRLGQRKAAIRALTQVVSLYPQDVEAVRALEELENIQTGVSIPVAHISRASVDTAPAMGRVEDFQVGSLSESLARAEVSSSAAKSPVEVSVSRQEEDLPSSAPDPEEEPEPTFATKTIAELYLRQGLKGKAIKVLRKILLTDPANSWARETLQDLESDEIVLPAKTSHPASKPVHSLKKKVKALELMLARVRLMKRIGA